MILFSFGCGNNRKKMTMKKSKRYIKYILNRFFPGLICKREFQTQVFRRFNERPIEYAFVFKVISDLYPQKVLDVGTGTTSLPHLIRNCGCLVTAADNIRDYWSHGMFNRHYYIINDDITETSLTDSFDLITCVSVLEHIAKPDDAVRNMFTLLKGDGYLILTFPYNESSYIKNVYDLPMASYGKNAPYITQSYSRGDLQRWLKENQAIVVSQEYWQLWTGEYWTQGELVVPPKRTTEKDNHQLTCVLLRKNSSTTGAL